MFFSAGGLLKHRYLSLYEEGEETGFFKNYEVTVSWGALAGEKSKAIWELVNRVKNDLPLIEGWAGSFCYVSDVDFRSKEDVIIMFVVHAISEAQFPQITDCFKENFVNTGSLSGKFILDLNIKKESLSQSISKDPLESRTGHLTGKVKKALIFVCGFLLVVAIIKIITLYFL